MRQRKHGRDRHVLAAAVTLEYSGASMTPARTLQLLAELGASAWLVRHHELVLEAAVLLCDRLHRELALAFDRELVLVGAAVHDAGKILHPDETRAEGHEHEAAGERLLRDHGVPTTIARFCVTHASWDAPNATLEDLLVALADKLWRGKRIDDLEHRTAHLIARNTKREPWEIFDVLDTICDAIAADGPARLARSGG